MSPLDNTGKPALSWVMFSTNGCPATPRCPDKRGVDRVAAGYTRRHEDLGLKHRRVHNILVLYPLYQVPPFVLPSLLLLLEKRRPLDQWMLNTVCTINCALPQWCPLWWLWLLLFL